MIIDYIPPQLMWARPVIASYFAAFPRLALRNIDTVTAADQFVCWWWRRCDDAHFYHNPQFDGGPLPSADPAPAPSMAGLVLHAGGAKVYEN